MNSSHIKRLVKSVLPVHFLNLLKCIRDRRLHVGWIHFGTLNRISPISRQFGFDRGTPIDRYYIEVFLSQNKSDVRGHVLEIGDATYTKQFGGDGVEHSDVLHSVSGNAEATVVGDLATGEGIPDDAFDCIILTQTYPFIYDLKSAVRNTFNALVPGGIALITLPGICQISRYDMDRWGDYWRFTSLGARRLFEEVFPSENVTVQTHGNVKVATALLYGLAVQDIKRSDLDYYDEDYEVTITIRAVKP